jgi:3-oxoacyl-[acyl-carrier protein] reductase
MGDALAGRVVVVTGSSRGIGAEVAVKAASEGATVAVHFHTGAEAAERTLARVREAGGDGAAFEADLEDGDQAEGLVRAAIDRFGRVDGLVNNAGRTQVGGFLDLGPDEWDAVIATDLTAAYRTSRAAIPGMVERGGGSIVNVASRLGQAGVARTAAYSAAKAGLIGLTRSLAMEFGPTGVRVNAVAPGFTLTEMTAAVLFLLTDASALFTGQTLNPNGGGYMP